MRIPTLALIPLLLLLAVGCAPPTQTFSVSVRNESPSPITIGLAKEGGPFEDNWATPEQASMDPQAGERRVWGLPVKPGKTASVPKVTGKFDRGSRPYLRIYQGDLTLSQVLAINRDSSNRIDIPLTPGDNSFVVAERQGRFVATSTTSGGTYPER